MAAALTGRAALVDRSLTEGEELRIESVWNDDTESDSCSALLLLWVKGLCPVDGRRESKLVAGEGSRVVDRLTISERRACWSCLRSVLMAAMGNWANEADRCVGSCVGSSVVARSIIFGRPADL